MLAEVAPHCASLSGVNVQRLLDRARAQEDAVEQYRLISAREALAPHFT